MTTDDETPDWAKVDELRLRQYAGEQGEPGDIRIEDHPWLSLLDALYQKHGANSDVHDFCDKFAPAHEEWFRICARLVVNKEIAAWLTQLEAEYDERSGGVAAPGVDFGMLRACVHLLQGLRRRIAENDYPKVQP